MKSSEALKLLAAGVFAALLLGPGASAAYGWSRSPRVVFSGSFSRPHTQVIVHAKAFLPYHADHHFCRLDRSRLVFVQHRAFRHNVRRFCLAPVGLVVPRHCYRP